MSTQQDNVTNKKAKRKPSQTPHVTHQKTKNEKNLMMLREKPQAKPHKKAKKPRKTPHTHTICHHRQTDHHIDIVSKVFENYSANPCATFKKSL